MDDPMTTNLRWWDQLPQLHAASALYDLDGFRAGATSLAAIEIDEVGDVTGRSLLHLQCHFGLDTLSWARRGAIVTGVDFSPNAIALASRLAAEIGVDARFVCSNVYDLDLDERFDVVFTSAGVLCWLPDLDAWAAVIARHLKPGATFYLREFHPFLWPFENEDQTLADLRVKYPYFSTHGPDVLDGHGSYAADVQLEHTTTVEWAHPLGEVVTALATAGLRLEFVHEFPYTTYKSFPFLVRDEAGHYRYPGPDLPLMYSIRARAAG